MHCSRQRRLKADQVATGERALLLAAHYLFPGLAWIVDVDDKSELLVLGNDHRIPLWPAVDAQEGSRMTGAIQHRPTGQIDVVELLAIETAYRLR